MVVELTETTDALLGTSNTNPFRFRTVRKYEDNMEGVEEVDRSDELVGAIHNEKIHVLISVVGRRAMSVAWKLAKKNGLKALCVPESIENAVAATALSFGFNTALSFAIELLDQVRTAARASRRIAMFIPEIPFDLAKVAQCLKENVQRGRPSTLIVVAEGARSASNRQTSPRARHRKEPMTALV